MAKKFRLVRPVRDTHGRVHVLNERVTMSREVSTLSSTMLEVIDPNGDRFLVIPEEVCEIGEEE